MVIGGGLLGLEAANGLKRRGMDVTVVHLAPWLMERQLDRTAGELLQKRAGSTRHPLLPRASDGRDRRRRATAASRQCASPTARRSTRTSSCMAVGIRPNVALAKAAGLHCDRGIVVNDTMQTFDPRIYAVGECVSHRGTCYGLVAPLFEMAKVAANHLANHGIGRYAGSVTATKLKVTGIDLFSAGDFAGGADTETITLSDPVGGVYKRLILKDDRIVGACLYGDTVDGSWYFKLMRDGRNVADIRDQLMFGEANLGDTGHQGHEPRAGDGRRRRGVRLQRRLQGQDRQRDQGEGAVHARGRAQAHEGVVVVRLLHGARRAASRMHGRRGLRRAAEEEARLRLHRSHACRSARGDPQAQAAVDSPTSTRPAAGDRSTAARRAGRPSTTT